MGNTSITDLPEQFQRQVREKFAAEDLRRMPLGLPPKGSKYGNRRTRYRSDQGFERVYDSAAEAAYAMMLDRGRLAGLVKWWLPQVPFPLPGGVVYRLDFLVQWTDRLSYVDVKGFDTQSSINKRKQVADLFGVEVELVRK